MRPEGGESISWEEELRQAAEAAATRREREGYTGFEGHAGPEGPPPPRGGRGPDLSVLFVMLDAVRRAVPGDLSQQFTALVRETLLTLRALIDWYLQRLERTEREPRVEDIPID